MMGAPQRLFQALEIRGRINQHGSPRVTRDRCTVSSGLKRAQFTDRAW
jgi:hypothetical protein